MTLGWLYPGKLAKLELPGYARKILAAKSALPCRVNLRRLICYDRYWPQKLTNLFLWVLQSDWELNTEIDTPASSDSVVD